MAGTIRRLTGGRDEPVDRKAVDLPYVGTPELPVFLNARDLEDGPKAFGLLVSIGIPLLVIYRVSGGNWGLALPLTAIFWFGARTLFQAIGRRLEAGRERRLDAAWQEEEARRKRLGIE